jgi:alanine dehydrogenase
MKPGTVFVDIAIDQGGCAETSRPTTHDNPTFVEEDVIHYCVTNMPGAYARTATQALTNVTFPYVQRLAESGVGGACAKHPELRSGINIQAGRVTNEAVATAHGLPFSAATV